MRYIIEVIRDYDQVVKSEHVPKLLSGINAVQKPSPYLFTELVVSVPPPRFFLRSQKVDVSSGIVFTLKHVRHWSMQIFFGQDSLKITY